MKVARKTLPPRLAELRERDPQAFLSACRKGGQNAGKKRSALKHIRAQEDLEEINRVRADEKLLASLAAVKAERNDDWFEPPDE